MSKSVFIIPICLLLLGLFSCQSNQNKENTHQILHALDQKTGLRLPGNINLLEDSLYTPAGDFQADYTKIYTLEFNQNIKDSLINQLNSLCSTNVDTNKGNWVPSNSGYYFISHRSISDEYTSVRVDVKTNRIIFENIDL